MESWSQGSALKKGWGKRSRFSNTISGFKCSLVLIIINRSGVTNHGKQPWLVSPPTGNVPLQIIYNSFHLTWTIHGFLETWIVSNVLKLPMGRRGTAFFCLGKSCKLLAAILFQGNSQRRDALKDEVLFHCWSRDVSDFSSSSGQSFWSSSYAFRTVSPFSEDLGELYWIKAMPHPDLRVRASDIKSHENPGIQTWGTMMI